MQGTTVRSLVQEDSTCYQATKSTRHNYWAQMSQSLCFETREATAMRSLHTTTGEQPPLLVTRESLCVGVKTQQRQKQINEQILKKKQQHLDPIFQPAWLAYLYTGHEPLETLGNFHFLKRTKLSQGLWAFTSTDSLLGHLCSPLPCFSLAAQMSGPALYTTSFWSPWTGETGSDAPPTRPHTPLLLPPLLPTS